MEVQQTGENFNSFLTAIDSHNVANGDKSWIENKMDSIQSFASDVPEAVYKGGVGAVVAGVNSILNSGIAVANFVGAEIDPISTYGVLKSLDDDLGKYYELHKEGIELAGFIGTSFLPGMAGVKALQAAKAGFLGSNMARSIGVLTSLTKDYSTAAKLEFATGSSPFSVLNQNVLKALGQGFGASALEAGAFELSVLATMHQSPVLDGQSTGSLIHNVLTGVVIGGGIGGILHGVGTIYGIKKAGAIVDKELFPYRHIQELDETASSDLKLLSYFQQKANIPEPAIPSGGFKELDPATGLSLMAKEAEKTKERLDILIRQEFNRFSGGDEKLGQQLYEIMKDKQFNEILPALVNTKSLARITEDEKLVLGDILFPTHGLKRDQFLETLAKGNNSAFFSDTATKGTQGFRVTGDLSKLKIASAGEKYEVGGYITNQDTAWFHGYDLFRNYNGKFSVNPGSSILRSSAGRRLPNNLVIDFESGGNIVDRATPGLADLASRTKPIEVRGNTVLSGDINPIRIGAKFNPLEEDYLTVQARYIWAQKQEFNWKNQIVDYNDFPILERAYFDGAQKTKGLRLRTENGKIVAAPEGEALKDYLYQKKTEFAGKLNGKPLDEIELRLNVSRKWLNGENEEIAKLRSGVDFNTPRYGRIDYPDSINAMESYNAAHIDGAIAYENSVNAIRQRHIQTFNNYAGGFSTEFTDSPNLSDPVRTPTRLGAGASLFGFANSNFGSIGGWAQYIGSLTNRLKIQHKTEMLEQMNLSAARIATPELRSELDGITNKLRSSPEAWVFHPKEANQLIPKKDFNRVSKGGTPSEFIEASDEVSEFLRTHSTINSARQVHVKNLKAAAGVMDDSELEVVYAPPINTTRYKHFLIVEPKGATLGDRKRMIIAKDESTLTQLRDQIDPQEFRIYSKTESEEWHKAIGDYEFQLGMNESLVDSTLKRKGVLSEHFAGNPSERILDDFLDWHIRQEEMLATRMVEHRYSQTFQELQHLGDRYTNIATSQFRSLTEALVQRVKDPYQDVVKTALDISRAGEYQWWKSFNDVVREWVESPARQLGSLFAKTEKVDDNFVQQVNQKLDQLGLGQPYTKAAMEIASKNIADKPFLAKYIAKAQSILSTSLLQLDFFNAINNVISTPVLLGAETKYLLNAIRSANPEVAGKLAQLMSVGVPESSVSQLTVGKLIRNSVENYRKDQTENLGLLTRYQQIGAVTDILQQERSAVGELTADFGKITAGQAESKLQKAVEFGKKWTGNKLAEETTRFVAADVMRQITDLALESGVLRNVAEANEYIQLFVNRVQGNYLHSQRPIVFQGVVGQAVSLFQTYQFNLMQQLFKFVGEGDKKAVGMLLGLQGSIYGMQGLPAFNFLNTHIVGNATGNTQHRDLYYASNSVFGKSLGDWLLYGAGSNALGLIDSRMKLNIYSRGDINPRNLTVLPTSFSDIPVVSASARFVSNLWQAGEKTGNGAALWPTTSQAIEHNGLSRPLTGLAQIIQGYTSTNQGSLLTAAQDFWSIGTVARLAGGKPFDEAVALDALYRINAYRAKDLSRIQEVGAALKTTLIKGGNPSEQDVVNFAASYAKSGGKIENFGRFMAQQMLGANRSQVNKVAEHLNTPFAQQLQVIMGGQALPDFLNTPVTK